jgi:hypothetical protein
MKFVTTLLLGAVALAGLYIKVGGRIEQALHLLRAQNDGQFAWLVHGAHHAHYLSVIQDKLEEKP